MKAFILSGFADEAGVSLEEQMSVLKKNGMNQIEMRGVDGVHVLDLDRIALDRMREKLDQNGFTISAIGSPVGKTPIDDDFAPSRALFEKACLAAKTLGTRYIRAFSYYMPKDGDPEEHFSKVVRRLGELVQIAEDNGLVYALENESGIYTDIPERCAQVIDALSSPSIKLAFDPGNFLFNGATPYPDAYQLLKSHIAYFHIKDADTAARRFVPCGQGDADMSSLLKAAYADGFESVLSLEPHLKYMEGLTDAQRFTTAVNALKQTLNQTFGVSLPLLDVGTLR